MRRSCNRLDQRTSEILSPVGDISYLVTSGVSRTTHPLISPFILPSTCVEDISPVSNGPVPGVVHGAPGYSSWRWTRGLRLINCGTQHPIDGFVRLYDHAPVSDDDDDDDDESDISALKLGPNLKHANYTTISIILRPLIN